jgi:beta-mannanase
LRRSKVIQYGSVLTAVLAGAVAPSSAQAVGKVLKISASDDGYTSSGRRTAAFGAEDKLAIGRLGTDVKTSFLKFTVPAGGRVTAAHLVLTTVGTPGGPITVRRVAATSWTEAKLTAGTAPVLGLPLGTATVANAKLTFDLSAAVKGAGTYSFALTGTGSVLRVQSAEGRYGAPELDVTTEHDASPPAPCVTGALLVPSCGVLWGGAAGGFTDAPRDQALLDWEQAGGRTSTIFHMYHKGDEIFPTKAEAAMTADPAHPRVLLLNWKIAYGSTWAKVAQGQQDKRIDAFALRAKAYGRKFFLVLNHEPENDIVAGAASGMQAKDFAAMYRHTILRLRASGVTNVVNVLAYMGNEKWMAQSWWKDLYPGDDVVDWIGLDSYVSVEPGYHAGLFADLLDRKAPAGPGFYAWATTTHQSKPLMIAEWGAYHRIGHPADKSAVYNSVLPELAKRPQIKAIVHFDTKHDDQGDRDISIDSTPAGLASFRKLAASPVFAVKLG